MGRSGHKSPLMRREYIKQYWFEHGKPPTIEHLQEQWKLRRRTLQKDLNKVIEEIQDPEIVSHIRSKFLWELNNRLEEMKDTDFVKLTKHFISEKAEITTDGISRLELVVVEPNEQSTNNVEAPPNTVADTPEQSEIQDN